MKKEKTPLSPTIWRASFCHSFCGCYFIQCKESCIMKSCPDKWKERKIKDMLHFDREVFDRWLING